MSTYQEDDAVALCEHLSEDPRLTPEEQAALKIVLEAYQRMSNHLDELR